MTREQVTIMNKSEIKEQVTIGNVVFNKNTASHCNALKRIGDACIAEYKAYQSIAMEAYKAGKLDGNKTVNVENKPRSTFNKEEFISVYGQAEYDRFCHKLDAYYVTFNG